LYNGRGKYFLKKAVEAADAKFKTLPEETKDKSKFFLR
jgi:hypothetical protein